LVSVLVRLRGRGNRIALEGVEGGVPAEGGALDAGGEGVDAGEGADVADLLGFSASAVVLPLSCTVISEALACEMAQPDPSKEMSPMRSPSSRK
jgi:hypothetical protein